MTLTLPVPARPEVSVVIVTYGEPGWPLRALEAVTEATDPVYEVVAVDNASPAAEALEGIEGLRLLRNDRNEGFAAAAHRGARSARGELLCFLNPDAFVRPGWLDALRRGLEHPGVGAVVPRFLGEDGRVQEAGSVVDRQGWTAALGAGADPGDPAWRFPRVVDYGSAACLLVPRVVYEAAGGFDPGYHPAYCEDVDLAFAMRAAGHATLYVPTADVVHAGAGSTDEETRARLIERNRPRLVERWGAELEWRPPLGELDAYPHRMIALRDAPTPERLLVVGGTDAAAEVAAAAARPLIARVTAWGAPAERAGSLAASGVEVVPREDLAWLAERAFHYTAVAAGTETWHAIEAEVAEAQPQAARILIAAGEASEAAPAIEAVAAAGEVHAPGWDGPAFPGVARDPASLLSWLGAVSGRAVPEAST